MRRLGFACHCFYFLECVEAIMTLLLFAICVSAGGLSGVVMFFMVGKDVVESHGKVTAKLNETADRLDVVMKERDAAILASCNAQERLALILHVADLGKKVSVVLPDDKDEDE